MCESSVPDTTTSTDSTRIYRAGTDYGKSPHFYKALIYPEALIAIMDAKRHRIYRNTIAPLFSPAAIELCTPRIFHVIQQAATKLKQKLDSGEPMEIQRMFKCFSVGAFVLI